MKTINRILTLFMALTILLCSVATLTSYAANDNQSDSESEIEELQPVMANPCKVPQHAYSMYSYLSNGGDPDIYIHHMYENTSYPRLPSGTTYTTYYVDNDPQKRLVMGANGKAYYSPDHYHSWVNITPGANCNG